MLGSSRTTRRTTLRQRAQCAAGRGARDAVRQHMLRVRCAHGGRRRSGRHPGCASAADLEAVRLLGSGRVLYPTTHRVRASG